MPRPFSSLPVYTSKLLNLNRPFTTRSQYSFFLAHYERACQASCTVLGVFTFNPAPPRNEFTRRTTFSWEIDVGIQHEVYIEYTGISSACLKVCKDKRLNYWRPNITRAVLSPASCLSYWSKPSIRHLNTSASSSYKDEENLPSFSRTALRDNLIEDINGDNDVDMDDITSQGLPVADVKEKSIPELSRGTYNLAPFVKKSATLQSLLHIGVDLSRIEKVKGMADHLVMSDFDKDILPYLQHLANVGVEPDRLGYIVSTNPLFLKLSLSDLEAQVGYLLSKKFNLKDIASMVSRAPVMLLMDPVKLDTKFGFLQKIFKLSGHDVRVVALTFPKLLPWRQEKIANIRFTLKEFLCFSDHELRQMIIKEPKLFTANRRNLMRAFDYVNNTMLIPHKQIVEWPCILRQRCHIIRSRHLFLLHKGRAQYDPYKENYVSMKAMLACKDEKFCEDIAKSTLAEYYKFLKTL